MTEGHAMKGVAAEFGVALWTRIAAFEGES
jgi:hypothetical protein